MFWGIFLELAIFKPLSKIIIGRNKGNKTTILKKVLRNIILEEKYFKNYSINNDIKNLD